ncbi:V-set and immunoglobulin domain-containing protein 10-like 2 [Pholidichthys leucotaenia]
MSPPPAVQIKHNGEVVYQNSSVHGVVDKAVILECGPSAPDLYIWSFTKPGTEAIRAVMYNVGKGPKHQKLAEMLGQLTIISNSANLSIENLPLAAHGLFTCQAFYDIEAEARVFYHYVHLTVTVPISKPYLQISDVSPVEGSTMWMHCHVENGTEPIQYKWQHHTNSKDFTTFTQNNSNFISLSNVSRNHTGWYRCVASNVVNNDSSDTFWLDIMFGPDLPQIYVTPSSKTKEGYSVLERETVSLLCEAQSYPASQYTWFYNNSRVHTGPQFTITDILRLHTGDYTCLAQNAYVNSESMKTISLTVYFPPDGFPSCSVEPALNHTSLRLLCSWPGGVPSPSLHWTGDQIHPWKNQSDTEQQTNDLLVPSDSSSFNSSLFTCHGFHPALEQSKQCRKLSYIPPAKPVCFVTNNNKYLMMNCSWDGGDPKALVWWEGPGARSGGEKDISSILVLHYSTVHFGKVYTCHAKHPLLVQTKTCTLTLEAPVLLTQRRVVSVYEGSDVELTCNLRSNYLPVNEITWFNNRGVGVRDTSKYKLLRTAAWTNLTVRDTEETQDSGEYRCSTSNAVGGTEINVTLVVKRYPMPPNATLVRVMYNSQQRNQVELEWQVEKEELGGWTGFILEHRWVSERLQKKEQAKDSVELKEQRSLSSHWESKTLQDPHVRSHTVGKLIPTVTYQFRIKVVNHRTLGHPSAAKTPAEPANNVYPAVIGAAIGGMLLAVILTVLLLMCIIRNHNNNPWLHGMLFGRQQSQSRENINIPEDEVVGESVNEISGSVEMTVCCKPKIVCDFMFQVTACDDSIMGCDLFYRLGFAIRDSTGFERSGCSSWGTVDLDDDVVVWDEIIEDGTDTKAHTPPSQEESRMEREQQPDSPPFPPQPESEPQEGEPKHAESLEAQELQLGTNTTHDVAQQSTSEG